MNHHYAVSDAEQFPVASTSKMPGNNDTRRQDVKIISQSDNEVQILGPPPKRRAMGFSEFASLPGGFPSSVPRRPMSNGMSDAIDLTQSSVPERKPSRYGNYLDMTYNGAGSWSNGPRKWSIPDVDLSLDDKPSESELRKNGFAKEEKPEKAFIENKPPIPPEDKPVVEEKPLMDEKPLTSNEEKPFSAAQMFCLGEVRANVLLCHKVGRLQAQSDDDPLLPADIKVDDKGRMHIALEDDPTIGIVEQVFSSTVTDCVPSFMQFDAPPHVEGESQGWLRAALPRVKGPLGWSTVCIFTVFSTLNVMDTIASRLHENRLFLEAPRDEHTLKASGIPFRNPQLLYNAADSLPAGPVSTVTSGERSADVNFEDLFLSVDSGLDLNETEAPSLVTSQLYPHQRQALSFLLDRETPLKTPPPLPSAQEVLARLQNPHENRTVVCLWARLVGASGAHMGWQHLVTKEKYGPGVVMPPQCAGALLADDMGLGKTVVVISLIAKTLESARLWAQLPIVNPLRALDGDADATATAPLHPLRHKSHATLIVCPVSVLQNWESQIEEHTRVKSRGALAAKERPALSVYVFHGNGKKIKAPELLQYDIVLVSFATLGCVYGRQVHQEQSVLRKKLDVNNPAHAKKIDTTLEPSLIHSIEWFRVVLDEAHVVREPKTRMFKACLQLQATKRILLSGTPLQNSAADLYALLKILRFHPFDNIETWNTYIGRPIKAAKDAAAYQRLQIILRYISLRRTKQSKDKEGRLLLELPTNNISLVRLDMSLEERRIYEMFHSKYKEEFRNSGSENILKNMSHVLKRILWLRQIASHPLLNTMISEVDYKGLPDSVAAQLPSPKHILETGQDILPDLTPKRALSLIFCQTTLDAHHSLYCNECNNEMSIFFTDGQRLSPLRSTVVVTACGHALCLKCVKEKMVPEYPSRPSSETHCCSCSRALNPARHLCSLTVDDVYEFKSGSFEDFYSLGKLVIDLEDDEQVSQKELHSSLNSPFNVRNYVPSTKTRTLIQDLLSYSRANPNSVNYAPDAPALPTLGAPPEKGRPSKSVIFSQWTGFMHLIALGLRKSNIRYAVLKGSFSRDQRTDQLREFAENPSCEVLLISLKAGGVGLNLTCAERVYIMEPFWNPSVENQAIDRVHRLGQTRPVQTIRFVSADTIEDRMLEIQKRKLDLFNLSLTTTLSKKYLREQRVKDFALLFE